MQERDGIVIANAGKRGGVVIIDVTDCIEKAERQLNNKEHRCRSIPNSEGIKAVKTSLENFPRS